MLKIVEGKEEHFRYLQGWLATTAAIDRIVAATETDELDQRSVEHLAPVPPHVRRARDVTGRQKPVIAHPVPSPQPQV